MQPPHGVGSQVDICCFRDPSGKGPVPYVAGRLEESVFSSERMEIIPSTLLPRKRHLLACKP